MGRSRKRKRAHDERRHVDGGVLPLLYPSSRLLTLHDLLVTLLLPSLRQHYVPPAPSSSSSTSSSFSQPGKEAAISEVYIHTSRFTRTKHLDSVSISQASLAWNSDAQQVPSTQQWHTAQAPQLLKRAFSDTLRRQSAPTAAMEEAILFAAAHSLLVNEGDPIEYLSLLHHSYGVLPDTAPPIGSTAFEQRWSHQQVIERVIQILFKQGRNSSNVLCFGFQQPRPRSSLNREKIAPAGLACVSDNAAVRILDSPAWKRLHSRVGDMIMLHLLSYADIFHPLPHRCYVQVAGMSVLLWRQHSKNRVKLVMPTEEGVTGIQDIFEKQGKVMGLNERKLGLHPKKVNSSIVCASSCTKLSGKQRISRVTVQDPNVPSKKRRRPHSWQRRKMARLLAQQTKDEVLDNMLEWKGLSTEPNSKDCPMGALELHHSSFIKGSPATYEIVPGVKADALTNSTKDDKYLRTLEYINLHKAGLTHEAINDKLITRVTSRFLETCLLCTAAKMEHLPFTIAKDREQEGSGFASRSLLARQNYDNQHQHEQKGYNFRVPPARFGISSGSGDGRRLINRSRMFYRAKFPHHAGLPKCHLLQRLKPTYKDAALLLKAIFGKEILCMSHTCGQCRFLCLQKCSKCICCLLKRLLVNRRKCQFSRFLKRHCPASTTSLSESPESNFPAQAVEHKTCAQKGSVGMERLQPDNSHHGFCSHSQVVSFIWAVCRRIVPEKLLGSKRNCRALRKNIYVFVSLRRHETFSLEQGMFKLRLSEYSWCPEQFLHYCGFQKELAKTGHRLGSRTRQQNELGLIDCAMLGDEERCLKKTSSYQLLKRLLLERWVYWLFTELIVPLIQSHFYVTESEKFKQKVLFYRKSVWATIKASAIKEMVKCNFKKLSAQSTFSLLKQGTLGFSRGRLLPKKQGTRLIANLGSSSAFPTECALNRYTVRGTVSKAKKKCRDLSNSGTRNLNIRETRRNGPNLLFKPINLVLRDIHNCLKYEQENHEDDLGCSVFDYNDAYLKLLPFIINRKLSSNGKASLYLVVCDALKAFDTIKQEKLMEIVSEFVSEEEYCVSRFGYALPNKESLRVFHDRSATSAIRNVSSLDSIMSKAEKQKNAVFIDLAYSVNLRRSHVLQLLKEHIFRNIVQIGRHFYLQIVGIPQGSILSSLLCSLYYGHFERLRLASILHLNQIHNNRDTFSLAPNHIRKAATGLLTKSAGGSSSKVHATTRISRPSSDNVLAASMKCKSSQSLKWGSQPLLSSACKDSAIHEESAPRNIMLRLIDDWLFISNSQDNALEFVRRMHRGFADYNCVANRLKTAVNFDAVIGGVTLNMNLYRTKDGACFIRWSGLLINCSTLEIQADYTRYSGVNLRSTLTVWRKNNQGIFLMTRLCQFMRPKCHPIFYDGNINCPATVLLNAYQAFILCAMKFHAYNCSLPCGGRCNPNFALKAVLKCARYMHSLLAHRTGRIAKRSQVKPLLLLQAKEAQWLALRAFQKVLIKKQSRYAMLLYLIKLELRSPKYEGLRETPLMLSALDVRRSSMFEDIVY